MLASSKKQKISDVLPEASSFVPVRILEIEIGQPLPKVSAIDEKTGHYYRRAKCLIRLHTQPLGTVDFPINGSIVDAEEYAPYIWNSLQEQINEHLHQDGLPPVTRLDPSGLSSLGTPRCIEEREMFLADAPFVSIIVSTRDRPDTIGRCLNSLLSLHYPRYEVIVIDNAPSTNTVADLLQQRYQDVSQIRYIREDRPGLSWARNSGVMAAKGEILAFTDDDVVVDRYWLTELVKAFSHAEKVACVTGLVLPLELETPTQLLFEQRGGSSRGFTERTFDIDRYYVHLYRPGRFGCGASMAFTVAFLDSVGGFDPALGTGSRARSAEETATFLQVITKGYKLVYEPRALLYHQHRRDYAALRKQIYGFGVGFTAYIMKSLIDNPRLLIDFFSKVPYDLFFRSHFSTSSKRSPSYPLELTWLERKGMLYGPFAYLLGRWAMRKANKDVNIRRNDILD